MNMRSLALLSGLPSLPDFEKRGRGLTAGHLLGLWILVAVSEEAFRAGMLNAADLVVEFKGRGIRDRWKILFANTVWVGFHFFQRPLDLAVYWKYVLWLYVTGLVITYVLMKVGLGSATLIHLIVNLTA